MQLNTIISWFIPSLQINRLRNSKVILCLYNVWTNIDQIIIYFIKFWTYNIIIWDNKKLITKGPQFIKRYNNFPKFNLEDLIYSHALQILSK